MYYHLFYYMFRRLLSHLQGELFYAQNIITFCDYMHGMESFKINLSYVFCTPLQMMCFLLHNLESPNFTFVEQKMN